MSINEANILIVEDEYLSYEYLGTILNKLGYQNIHYAQSCKEAKKIIMNKSIDFSFMDINIKDSIDGINCARELNNKCNLPIIYTTVYKDLTTLNDAKNSNIYGYITKPFDINDVFIAIAILDKFIKNQSSLSGTSIFKQNSEFFDFGEKRVFDLKKLVLMSNDVHIKLSNQETLLLEFFCRNPEQYLSYEILRNHIWNNMDVSNSTIRDTIYRLKQKFPGTFPIKNSSTLGYFLTK